MYTNKNLKITVRVNKEEKVKIEQKAKELNCVSVSQYARDVMMEKKILPPLDVQCILQLQKIGTNVNQITKLYYQDHTGTVAEETIDQLNEYWLEVRSIIDQIKNRI